MLNMSAAPTYAWDDFTTTTTAADLARLGDELPVAVLLKGPYPRAEHVDLTSRVPPENSNEDLPIAQLGICYSATSEAGGVKIRFNLTTSLSGPVTLDFHRAAKLDGSSSCTVGDHLMPKSVVSNPSRRPNMLNSNRDRHRRGTLRFADGSGTEYVCEKELWTLTPHQTALFDPTDRFSAFCPSPIPPRHPSAFSSSTTNPLHNAIRLRADAAALSLAVRDVRPGDSGYNADEEQRKGKDDSERASADGGEMSLEKDPVLWTWRSDGMGFRDVKGVGRVWRAGGATYREPEDDAGHVLGILGGAADAKQEAKSAVEEWRSKVM